MYSSRFKMTSSCFKMTRNLAQKCLASRAASTAAVPQYEALAVTSPKPYVYHVELNRPKNLNAINRVMWFEIGKCFDDLADNTDCRVIILSGAGRLFTAGIDLNDLASLGSALAEQEDVARRCAILNKTIHAYQQNISALERCSKPVISTVHSACLGAGVNLVTAADIRYCTTDAWFQVKEVDIGMAADVGVLQRMSKVIGSESLARELAFTARKIEAAEAKECGLVSKVFDNKDSMISGAIDLAADIAAKSPVAVQLTKRSIVFSRDHSVQEGLDHIRHWNMTMLQSEDFLNATVAQATKSPPPTFAKL